MLGLLLLPAWAWGRERGAVQERGMWGSNWAGLLPVRLSMRANSHVKTSCLPTACLPTPCLPTPYMAYAC